MIRITALTLFVALACESTAFAQSGAPATAACAPMPSPAGTALPDAGTVLVRQICQDGRRVDAATVGIGIGSAAAVPTAIKSGQSFATPATFATPPGITLDTISANGSEQRISPSTSLLAIVNKTGEFYGVTSGHLAATVTTQPIFYYVQSLKAVSATPGTTFELDAKPKAVTFGVTAGALRTSRLVSVHLAAENKTIEGIRETDTIAPGELATVAYPVPFPVFKTFANAAEAEAFFTSQLHDAQSGGNEPQIENALENLDLVQGITQAR
jgi:hypothetical protein